MRASYVLRLERNRAKKEVPHAPGRVIDLLCPIEDQVKEMAKQRRSKLGPSEDVVLGVLVDAGRFKHRVHRVWESFQPHLAFFDLTALSNL